MEGERSEECGGQASGFWRNDIVRDAEAMKDAEDGEQGEEQRGDAGEADEVELAETDGGERAPAAEGHGSNQEAGDREEDLHAALALPYESDGELPGEGFCIGDVRAEEAHIDVVEEDVKDGERAQGVDAVYSGTDRSGTGGRSARGAASHLFIVALRGVCPVKRYC